MGAPPTLGAYPPSPGRSLPGRRVGPPVEFPPLPWESPWTTGRRRAVSFGGGLVNPRVKPVTSGTPNDTAKMQPTTDPWSRDSQGAPHPQSELGDWAGSRRGNLRKSQEEPLRKLVGSAYLSPSKFDVLRGKK